MGNPARKHARQFTLFTNLHKKSPSNVLVSSGKCECVDFFAINDPNGNRNLRVGILRHGTGQPPNVSRSICVVQERSGSFESS